MRQQLKLVPDSISKETVEALAHLHQQAKEGKIVGIVFAAMYKGRMFVANSAGDCHYNPIWSIGMVDVLKHKLRSLAIHGSED